MSLVSLFFASQLGIFSLKIGKNHRYLELGMVPFISTSYIRKKNAGIGIISSQAISLMIFMRCNLYMCAQLVNEDNLNEHTL